MIAITILTVLSLSIFVAMIAASLYVADKMEARRNRDEADLTPLQRAMLAQMDDQP